MYINAYTFKPIILLILEAENERGRGGQIAFIHPFAMPITTKQPLLLSFQASKRNLRGPSRKVKHL